MLSARRAMTVALEAEEEIIEVDVIIAVTETIVHVATINRIATTARIKFRAIDISYVLALPLRQGFFLV